MYHEDEVKDLKSNKAWGDIKNTLIERYEACVEELLKLDVPEAVEARLIRFILDMPRDLQERAIKQGGNK